MAEEEPKLIAVCPACRDDITKCEDCTGILDVIAHPGGWCAPSEALYAGYKPEHLEFPKVSVKRGGMRFPRFPLTTRITVTGRWWWKKAYLHVSFCGNATVHGPWKPEQARLAEQQIELLHKMFDDSYHEELQRAR